MDDRAVALLGAGAGFLQALYELYGATPADGYARIVCIRRIRPTPRFTSSRSYRRSVVSSLAAANLGESGWIAIEPSAASARGAECEKSSPPGASTGRDPAPALSLCHLFGSIGSAQLCDPQLGEPVPVLVQPWHRGRGLLRASTGSMQPFSRYLRVERLGPGRMILLDRRRW